MKQSSKQYDLRGRITLEYWETSAPGSPIGREELTVPPDGRSTIEKLSILAGWTRSHTVRIRGYLHPPVTGEYVFTSCGHVDLYLGETHLTSPSRQVLSSANTHSAAVSLEAGMPYYIEVVSTAGCGDATMQVG